MYRLAVVGGVLQLYLVKSCWDSGDIFVTSWRSFADSLNGCTSEPSSAYLCSWKAQLQSAGLNYFCVQIHQAEIPRVNSSEGPQQLCRITCGIAGPVPGMPRGWLMTRAWPNVPVQFGFFFFFPFLTDNDRVVLSRRQRCCFSHDGRSVRLAFDGRVCRSVGCTMAALFPFVAGRWIVCSP